MKEQNNTDEPDESFWAFIHLVLQKPEEVLNYKGRILYKIVEENGRCEKITLIAKWLNCNPQYIWSLCCKPELMKYIEKERKHGRTEVTFNKQTIAEGKRLLNAIKK